MPSPVASRGPHGRHCPLVREPCSLCLRRVIRGAGIVEPVRGPDLTSTPGVRAAILERMARFVQYGSDSGR